MPIWPNLKKNLKEKVILYEVKKGDSQAFVWLYDQYAPLIYRFVYLKTNSPHDSEDLTSEVFFKFWRQLENKSTKIKDPRSFLYQIARNSVVDYYRKKAKSELIINENQEQKIANLPNKQDDLQKKTVLASDLGEVKMAISQLKPKYQDMIIWHYLDDFSVKEIASILNQPENTIRVQIHRALKALKSVMK